MSEISPLLLHTVTQVLTSLLQSGEIEIESGREADIVQFCGTRLAAAGIGAQVVDTLSKALLDCDHVHELYADNLLIKEMITGVGEP